MRIYKKEGTTLQVISFPSELIEKGDYLAIRDPTTRKSLIVQVISIHYANIPGILEELLRDYNGSSLIQGEDVDPFQINSHVTYIQDARLLICKIRATSQDGELVPANSWLPSRSHAIINRLQIEKLAGISKNDYYKIHLGKTIDKKDFFIDVRNLDGCLNIITGKKGTGKSYMSKLLTLGFVKHGAPVVIFDLNNEYTGLGHTIEGEPNEFYEKINVLTPRINFKVTLAQVKLRVMLNILIHALQLPGTSAREFRRIWHFLEDKNCLNMYELGESIKSWKCNQHVRDALFSRFYTLLNSGIFTDQPTEARSLEDSLVKIKDGGAIVINLHDTSPSNRYIIVEYVLGKLVEVLTNRKHNAIFLFAEEAHLYLRETYWTDIVTRMRHFGLFTTFITNQPDTIRDNIYRQTDNLFIFNFTNEHDLEMVSRVSKVDSETVKSVVRDLPAHHCFLLGRMVKDFPMVTKVKNLNVQAMGQTRLFFSSKKSLEKISIDIQSQQNIKYSDNATLIPYANTTRS